MVDLFLQFIEFVSGGVFPENVIEYGASIRLFCCDLRPPRSRQKTLTNHLSRRGAGGPALLQLNLGGRCGEKDNSFSKCQCVGFAFCERGREIGFASTYA